MSKYDPLNKDKSTMKKLFEMIFSKELEDFRMSTRESYDEQSTELKQQLLKAEQEAAYYKKYFNLLKDIFKDYSGTKVVGVEKNKNGIEMIIVIYYKTIYLYSPYYYYRAHCLPKLFFEEYSYLEGGTKKKCLKIADVLMYENNVGNGSIAMQTLIKYAKEKGMNKIVGELSSVDSDHADRRDHYYRKFGFKIIDSNILLDLK